LRTKRLTKAMIPLAVTSFFLRLVQG